MHLAQLEDRQPVPKSATIPFSRLPTGGVRLQWDFGDKSVAVEFHVNAVERLESEAFHPRHETTKNLAGVLLGRVHCEDVIRLVIEDYEAESSSDSVAAIVHRWRECSNRRLEALGIYQVTKSDTLVPDDDYLTVISNQLTDKYRVFLFIGQQPGKPSTGTLFLLQRDVAIPENNWIQFPFTRMQLACTPQQLQAGSNRKSVALQNDTPCPVQPKAGRGPLPFFLLLVCVGICAVIYIGPFGAWETFVHRTPNRSSDSALNLKAEQHGSSWQLSWNSRARPVMTAVRARLLIIDGSFRKNVDVTPVDLRGGTIFYVPATDDAVLRLELVSQSNETVTESVRIMGGLLPPAAASILNVGGRTAAHDGFNRASLTNTATNVALVNSIDPSTTRSNISSNPAIVAVPNGSGTSLRTQQQPDVHGEGMLSGLSPAHNLSEGKKQSSTNSSAPIESFPAQPVLLINPVYPTTALDQQLQGQVIVRAVVEEDGKIGKTWRVSGPTILAQAAIQAIREWRYAPATLNGKRVQSEIEVYFNFKLP